MTQPWTKQMVVDRLLAERALVTAGEGRAFAPANIALCKYWGKRDEELNLPVTGSLSVSLGALGSHCCIRPCDGADRVTLAGSPLPAEHPFCQRLSSFLDLFRGPNGLHYAVTTENSIPTAAGFASSASGFAAVVLALDDLHGWALSRRELSVLARLGSGSACRSLWQGLVEWEAGTAVDGMDSVAHPLEARWDDLRVGLLVLEAGKKPIGSREAMRRTVGTSPCYQTWPDIVARDMASLKAAIAVRDFPSLGQAAETNALAMHATMMTAQPPVLYWKPASVAAMHAVWEARADGLELYFTMDAGPNLKLLFLAADAAAVGERFPALRVTAAQDDQ
jgi:diphosphomevalonate decarboxylase